MEDLAVYVVGCIGLSTSKRFLPVVESEAYLLTLITAILHISVNTTTASSGTLVVYINRKTGLYFKLVYYHKVGSFHLLNLASHRFLRIKFKHFSRTIISTMLFSL